MLDFKQFLEGAHPSDEKGKAKVGNPIKNDKLDLESSYESMLVLQTGSPKK